jgi:peptide deformylase
MAIRPIVRLGHPAIRQTAQPVDPAQLADPELQALIDDMLETMRDADGVGLAAPQVGVPLQLFVYLSSPESQHPVERVLINPTLVPERGDLVEDWEGCLSIPDLRGLVPRHHALRVIGLDRQGKTVDERVAGLEARILQHELDHLNGIVFLDRMRDMRSLAFTDEWADFLAEDGEEAEKAG